MLLGAEWRPHMMCFVKQTKHDNPDENGYIWPAPTFEFFDREGKEIEGPRKQSLMKVVNPQVKVNIPDFRHSKSVFDHQLIDKRIMGSFQKAKTATEVQAQMDAAMKKATESMAKQMDDHLLDALMYGSSFGEMKAPKDMGDSISFRSLSNDLKVMRPGIGVYKISDA